MLTHTTITKEHKNNFLVNQDAKNVAQSQTEQLRSEIILAKVLESANLFHTEKKEDAYHKASEVLALTDPSGAPLHRLSRILMNGIQRRCYSQAEFLGNLYSDETNPIAMIKAYDVLVKHTPFIRFAYNAINLAILAKASNTNRLHIIDIGIGFGNQWSALFALLQGTSFYPKKIHITGIDIPGTESTLNEVRNKLINEAKEVGIEFSFTPLVGKAEQMSFADIERVPGEFLVINAALALHHTPSGDAIKNSQQSRASLLLQLRGLEPQLLTMVEPDSNHNLASFEERCYEAFQHYMHIFNAFEYLFPRHLKERAILENDFFGREIINIVTANGSDRVERHERKEIWAKHMQDAGFAYVENIFERTSRTLRNIVPTSPPFQIFQSNHALCLGFNSNPLLAASCWRTVN
ncbi:GRAS family protein [Undibacterium sp. RuRC25W]|uniref:GRAS family protein n=1 Tax=Undibacterium sp. RuRC25W TaxID=3413047 RepID=UPI003BF1F6A7